MSVVRKCLSVNAAVACFVLNLILALYAARTNGQVRTRKPNPAERRTFERGNAIAYYTYFILPASHALP